ncbi:MAG: 4-(cytidine 5'-diphospho)-2-C-methyl-D-erythritol kinase [Acidobacteria bacterium]|nr:4-(cytidine 5'-diphospho)-2-C-methyl-D-erythritol kinase [Acidobacteriota bacterium]
MPETYRSFAKINLHLQIDGRLPDGYHQLRTLFQTVSLHDLISIEPRAGSGIELRVPEGGAPEDASNLAYRAAKAILDRWAPDQGVSIELRKRIPAGGGLGGGSSNAATVLQAVPEILGLEVAAEDLRSVARALGADVPYFLVGGTALGVGRGDEIIPLSELAEQEVLLVDPGVSVSTAEVFAALGPPRPRPLPAGIVDFLAGAAVRDIAALDAFNDLERPVLDRFPRVRSVYNALRRAGASCVRLSGSGATVFACFADSRQGGEVEAYLPSEAKVYAVRTMSRAAVRAARSASDSEGNGL